MQNGYTDIKSAGAEELIAISSDSSFGLRNLLNNNNLGITYLLLSDEDTLTIGDYNVAEQHGNPNHARPATYIIDENGKIAWKDLGARFGHRTSSDQIITALNELESL